MIVRSKTAIGPQEHCQLEGKREGVRISHVPQHEMYGMPSRGRASLIFLEQRAAGGAQRKLEHGPRCPSNGCACPPSPRIAHHQLQRQHEKQAFIGTRSEKNRVFPSCVTIETGR